MRRIRERGCVMNNEDKILALLERVTGQLDGLDQRMDGLDQRMDGLDQRMDGLDQRMDALEQRMDGLEHNQTVLEEKMDRRFEQVNANLRAIWHDLDYALERIDEHEKKYHSAG